MQFRYTLFICFLIRPVSVCSQDINLFHARKLALSGSDVTCSDTWSGLSNPAGLGMYSSFDIGINYNNRFFISELSSQVIVSTIPTEYGVISPWLSYYGSELYNESQFCLGYGKLLANWISMGVCIAYNMQTVETTSERASAITGQVGMITIPVKGLRIGVDVKNPTGSAYGRFKGEKLPSGLDLGISYSEEQNYLLALQTNWNDFKTFSCSMGAEYYIIPGLIVRAGLKFPAALSYSFGSGFIFRKLTIDLGFEQHSVLGMSSAFTIHYTIK